MPFLVVIPYDFYRVSNYRTGRALTKDLISFIAADFIHYFSCMIATNCVKQLRLLRDLIFVQVIYWAASISRQKMILAQNSPNSPNSLSCIVDNS